MPVLTIAKPFTTALDRIIAIQAALQISSPVVMSVQKAYKYHPRQNVAMPDLPAFFNNWGAPLIERSANMRTRRYQVTIQFVAARAGVEDDQSADIATAFWEQCLDAFDADLSLNRTVTLATLRGGDPTLLSFEHGGQAYIGFQAFLDIQITGAFTFS